MGKKINSKEALEKLSQNTQLAINQFLKHYAKSSHANYISAIIQLFKLIDKSDVKELKIEDYENTVIDTSKSLNIKKSHDKYRTSFFRFIYAFDIIEDENGFDKYWVKDREKIGFIRKIENKKNDSIIDIYKPSMTIRDITRIEKILYFKYEDNKDMLKLAFIWDSLFYRGLKVEELKKIKGRNYSNGKIKIKGKEFSVSERFDPLFKKLKEYKNDGFNNLDGIVRKLGKLIDFENLTPQIIVNARNENMIKCSMCGERYINKIDNWISVNNRIICVECAEELKKNYNYDLNDIDSMLIDNEADENKVFVFNTYEELKAKLNKEIDYLKLHQYQIEIGKLGEAFVTDYEKDKLRGTKYEELVDNTVALDNRNGYDILSYEKNGEEIYIEVKTEAQCNNDFFMSQNEITTGKKLIEDGKKYLVYRVSNILAESKDEIKLEIIDDIFNNPKYHFEVNNWRIKIAD